MASRKVLKKECQLYRRRIVCRMSYEQPVCTRNRQKKADELMAEILKMQDEFISRISHTEPGNVKGYYKKFRSDFNAKVDEIIEAIGNLK